MRHKGSTDPFHRPTFGILARLRRLTWHVAYLVGFRFSPTPFHGWRCLILRVFGARIGKANYIYPTARIWAPWLLETGDVVTIAHGVEVYNPGGVRLAHHTIVSQHAYLCGATHDFDSRNFDYVKKLISSEPYAWICAKAIVLPGVTCKTGSVLGAGAVASKDLEAWTVYAGNPCKAVRQRQAFDVETLPGDRP